MRLRLFKLQDNNKKAKSLGLTNIPKDWKNNKKVFWYQRLLYIPEIIFFKVISCHYNDPLGKYFGIDKT